jgi:hypothetical protein
LGDATGKRRPPNARFDTVWDAFRDTAGDTLKVPHFGTGVLKRISPNCLAPHTKHHGTKGIVHRRNLLRNHHSESDGGMEHLQIPGSSRDSARD